MSVQTYGILSGPAPESAERGFEYSSPSDKITGALYCSDTLSTDSTCSHPPALALASHSAYNYLFDMTIYKNTYEPHPPAKQELGELLSIAPEDYDFNFVFGVKTLRTDRVELRPYVVSAPMIINNNR